MHKKTESDDPGKEAMDSKTSDGVTIPEQFQKDCHEFMGKCTTEDHVDHVRSVLSKHHLKMMEKGNKKGGKVSKFSSEDMPKS